MWRLIGLVLAIGGLVGYTRASDDAPEAIPGKLRLTPEVVSHTAAIHKLFFSKDGKELITLSPDSIRVWDVESGEMSRVLRRWDPNRVVAVAPGRHVIACATWNDIEFLNWKQERLVDKSIKMDGWKNTFSAMEYSRDSKLIAAGCWSGFVDIVEVSTGKRTIRLDCPKACHPRQLHFSPQDKRLLGVSSSWAWVWDPKTGQTSSVISKDKTPILASGWLSPERIILGTDVGIEVWEIKNLAAKPTKVDSFDVGLTTALTVDSQSRVLRVGRGKKGKDQTVNVIRWMDPTTGKETDVSPSTWGGEEGPPDVAISADGSRVACGGGANHRVHVYDATKSKILWRQEAHGLPRFGVGWSADGKSILWGSKLEGNGENPATYHKDRPLEWAFDLVNLDYIRDKDRKTGLVSAAVRGPLELKGLKLVPQRVLPYVQRGKEKVQLKVHPLTPCQGGALLGDDLVILALRQKLTIADARTGDLLINFPKSAAVFDDLMDIAVSPNGKWLLTGSLDQNLQLWPLEPMIHQAKQQRASAEKPKEMPVGKADCLIFLPSKLGWVLWSEPGYYAANMSGERLVGWLVKTDSDRLPAYYPIDRFRKALNQPNLIKNAIELGSIRKALKEFTEMTGGKEVDVGELLPPSATLVKVEQKGNKVKVKASASPQSRSQPVTQLRLMLDGRPLPEGKGRKDIKEGEKAEDLWEVDVPAGSHELTLLVRSTDAFSTSEPLIVEGQRADEEKPTLHALCIGVGNYDDTSLILHGPEKDAKVLAETLKACCAGKGNLFKDVKPTVLVDVDSKTMLAALDQVRKEVKQGDLLIVFFSGHGDTQKNEFYLLTREAKIDDLARTAVKGSEMRKKLGDMPCQVLLLLDACHSADGAKAFRGASDDAARSVGDEECAVAVLSAAMGNEKAENQKGQGGHFTRAVVGALQVRDLDKALFNRARRELSVHHLYVTVLDEVARTSNERQHPFLHMPSTTPSFPLRRVPEK